MLHKIENSRKKADELQRVRQSYDEQMRMIKQASFEREVKMSEAYEQNQSMRNMQKTYITDKFNQIFYDKKANHDEVKNLKKCLQREKVEQLENFQKDRTMHA